MKSQSESMLIVSNDKLKSIFLVSSDTCQALQRVNQFIILKEAYLIGKHME